MTLRLPEQALSLYIPSKRDGRDLMERVAEITKERGVTQNNVIVDALLDFLDREEGHEQDRCRLCNGLCLGSRSDRLHEAQRATCCLVHVLSSVREIAAGGFIRRSCVI